MSPFYKNTKRGCLHFWGSSIREEARIIWWQPPKNSQTIWCLSRSKTPATMWCLSVQRNGLIDWVGSALHKFQWKVSAEKCSSTFYFFSAQKTIALSYMSNMRNLRWWYTVWYISNMEIIFDWYGDDICLILRWYLSDTEMIFVWYGDDICLILRWYLSDTEMIFVWYGHDICLRRRPSESSATADV